MPSPAYRLGSADLAIRRLWHVGEVRGQRGRTAAFCFPTKTGQESFLPSHPKLGEADRWAWFSPVPIYYGVGDAVVDRMRDRLGAEPFRRLEACVRRGVVPAEKDRIALLDDQYRPLRVLEEAQGGGRGGGASGPISLITRFEP